MACLTLFKTKSFAKHKGTGLDRTKVLLSSAILDTPNAGAEKLIFSI
jgi:hypothetical protein